MFSLETKLIIYPAFWFFLWFILAYLIVNMKYLKKLKNIRKDAVKRSKSVILWNVKEKLAPLLPNFKYNLKDLVFLGKWIDYIAFDWLSQWNLKQIAFLEIKTWKSKLNSNEKQIKKIVDSKKVKYELINL